MSGDVKIYAYFRINDARICELTYICTRCVWFKELLDLEEAGLCLNT